MINRSSFVHENGRHRRAQRARAHTWSKHRTDNDLFGCVSYYMLRCLVPFPLRIIFANRRKRGTKQATKPMNGACARAPAHSHTHTQTRDTNSPTSTNWFRQNQHFFVNANFNHFLRLTRPNRLQQPLQRAFVRVFVFFIFFFDLCLFFRALVTTHTNRPISEKKKPVSICRCCLCTTSFIRISYWMCLDFITMYRGAIGCGGGEFQLNRCNNLQKHNEKPNRFAFGRSLGCFSRTYTNIFLLSFGFCVSKNTRRWCSSSRHAVVDIGPNEKKWREKKKRKILNSSSDCSCTKRKWSLGRQWEHTQADSDDKTCFDQSQRNESIPSQRKQKNRGHLSIAAESDASTYR